MNIKPQESSERCAIYLKALADSTRLKIVRALQSGPLSVSDLVLLLELDMAIVSHHLRVLYHADIAVTKREGKFIYYSLNENLLCQRKSESSLNFGCCKLEMN